MHSRFIEYGCKCHRMTLALDRKQARNVSGVGRRHADFLRLKSDRFMVRHVKVAGPLKMVVELFDPAIDASCINSHTKGAFFRGACVQFQINVKIVETYFRVGKTQMGIAKGNVAMGLVEAIAAVAAPLTANEADVNDADVITTAANPRAIFWREIDVACAMFGLVMVFLLRAQIYLTSMTGLRVLD